MTDAHDALTDALLALFPGASIASSRQRSWASATFIGARHWFELNLVTPAPEAILADLPHREFRIDGHIVADVRLPRHRSGVSGYVLELEALTVEES